MVIGFRHGRGLVRIILIYYSIRGGPEVGLGPPALFGLAHQEKQIRQGVPQP